MKSLKTLQAGGKCGIDQNGIKNLNLIALYYSDNEKITDVSFMQSVKVYS